MNDCSAKGHRYPLYEFIEWPFHLIAADTDNPLGIVPLPNPCGTVGGKKVGFIGDVMPLRSGEPVTIDEPVRKLLQSFDALVCNLEAPVLEDSVYKGAIEGLKLAFSRKTAAATLDALGTDPERTYISLGNNHANDHGLVQFRHTVRFLRERRHPIIGCSDRMLGINELELDGLRMGLVGWTHWLNDEWTGHCHQFRPTIRKDVMGVDFHRIKEERRLDCVTLFSHWSYEFKHFPRHPFDEIAKQLADAGVDVNIGGHPHCVAPLAKVGSNSFVHYSIGDFSGLHEHWHTRLGCIVALSAKKGPHGLELGFERTPIYREKQAHGERVTTLDRLPDDLRKKCEDRFALVNPHHP